MPPGSSCAASDARRRVDLHIGDHHALLDAEDARDPAFALRAQVFRRGVCPDVDRFDAACLHGAVRDTRTGRVLVAFRLRAITDARDLASTYTAQHYDLGPLASHAGPWIELGRFCRDEDACDLAALRLAWALITRSVDAWQARLLFGCSTFPGIDPAAHAAAFACLRRNHLGPAPLRPLRISTDTCALPEIAPGEPQIPMLLRSYLTMGAWVGDHAVRDIDLGTLHVFTALRIADIPEVRKRSLRALAARAGQGTPPPLDLVPAAP